MRLIGKTAIALAIISFGSMACSTVSAQESGHSGSGHSGHRVAVVDVAFIFKNHPGIKSQVSKVENDLKSYDAELQAKRQALKTEAERLKAFNPGSPEYAAQEEKVASMDSKLRLDMARKRKDLADAEARIYFENYQRIAAGVKFLAEHYKIDLVLRYNSESMELEKGDSVIRGVMKNVVYYGEGLDMTKGVMQYLDKTLEVAGAGGNTVTK